jgi:acyl-coenzyme A thioesterase PaaI-like protein
MNVLEIPFVDKVGIQRNADGELELPFNHTIQNHLETIHASAQFTLAETASGEALQTIFPELSGKVIPVLRGSEIKFKKPAAKTISAHPTVSDEALEKFREQFKRKGRSSISVDVKITDSDNVVTCVSTFNWFVQSIEKIKT